MRRSRAVQGADFFAPTKSTTCARPDSALTKTLVRPSVRPSVRFCYVNDCVLAILEMLKHNARVLYIDIDIHHGDGVEEAFYCTDRVMTLSTHLYRPEWFFPGTGSLTEIGEGQGRGYSVNVPLVEGCTDEDFMFMFKPILERIMDVFKPSAICLQCLIL